MRRSHRLLHQLLNRLRGKIKQEYYNILDKYDLIKFETVTKENVLLAHNEVKEIYEKYRSKSPKNRFVDFNQGTDARYVTEEIMKKMSQIPN